MIKINKIYNEDCFNMMSYIPDKFVDMILTDPPYNTTACVWEWDVMTRINELWVEWKRIIKDNGAIVMTASQPFTSKLVMSNLNGFAFAMVWDKCFGSNFVQAKRQPIKDHEDILIFSKTGKQPNYFPQMLKRDKPIKKGGNKQSKAIPIAITDTSKLFGKQIKVYVEKFPTSQIRFNCREGRGLHPTQKPVALFEYLIKTYTNEGDLVLDPFIGGGTTAIACINTNRNFIGIELDENYCNVAKKRIEETLSNKEKI